MPLTPVFGLNVSGGLAIAPPPFVLPFPGVPTLSGSLGASVAVPGGSVSGGASIGPGGISGGVSGSVGPVSGGLSLGPGGVSGGVGINAGPLSGSISLGPGGISGSLGGSLPGLGGGGITIGPDGISGGLSVGIGGISAQISGSTAAGLTGSLSGGFGPFGFSLAASMPPLLTGDIPGGLFQGPKWGVFDKNNRPIAPWDSVTKIEYKHEFRIADFPIEQGGFESYNKVQMPFDVRISFVVGSNARGANQRAAFLVQLEQAVKSLDMFTVITPEAVYKNANLVHLEYTRESHRGVNLLVADVWVQEVRQTTGSLTTTASPTSQAPNNNGKEQAQTVPLNPEPFRKQPEQPPALPMPPQGSTTTESAQPPPAMPGEVMPPSPPTPPPPEPRLPGEPTAPTGSQSPPSQTAVQSDVSAITAGMAGAGARNDLR